MVVPSGILSVVALLPNKYNGKGQKGTSSQDQKPLGQCYLGGAVHYWAILAVAPTGILSVIALLTNRAEGHQFTGPKAPGSVLSWPCYSLLGHLGSGPYWDSFNCSTAVVCLSIRLSINILLCTQ